MYREIDIRIWGSQVTPREYAHVWEPQILKSNRQYFGFQVIFPLDDISSADYQDIFWSKIYHFSSAVVRIMLYGYIIYTCS